MPSLLDSPTDTTTTVSFPTAEDLNGQITAKIAHAYNVLEQLGWNLGAVTGCSSHRRLELDRPPTFDDLGTLWSFLSDVETDVELISRYVDELKDQLEMVDMLRRERQVALGRRLEAVA